MLFRLVLRIITDDSGAVCRFSMKFGADMNTARKLIDRAQDIGMDVVGVRWEDINGIERTHRNQCLLL